MENRISQKEVDKIREQALRSFHQMFDRLGEGAFVVDKFSQIIWANSRYLDFLGVTDPHARAAVIGRHIADVVPATLMPQVVESGNSIPFDIIDVNKRFVAVSRFPIRDDAGEVIGGFCFVLFDDLAPLQPIIARIARLQDDLEATRGKLERVRRTRYNFSQFIGNSQPALEVKRQAKRAAASDSTVLLQGESGTGKEMVAQAIHAASPRAAGNFVAVNVAAIPSDLLEAEFFGAAPGAYTGLGPKGRTGKMALANGGTLFLDEIGDMPLAVQVKLLRALQEREVEQIGSNSVVKLDIRVIAASSKDLSRLVSAGKFRADLYYRLSVLPIHMPALRERAEDIPLLVEVLLEDVCKSLAVPLKEVDDGAMRFLTSRKWPGNIRELRNVLERACVFSGEPVLTRDHFHHYSPGQPSAEPAAMQSPLHQSVSLMERDLIAEALQRAGGNKTLAAKILGISRSNLYVKIEAFGLSADGTARDDPTSEE